MLKRLTIAIFMAILSTSPIFAKTFSLEAQYGFGAINIPTDGIKLKGTAQEAGLRAIFFTTNFTHEILGKSTFTSSIDDHSSYKYSNWEAEYRFGARMDNDMQKLGMLEGSAYLGLGYESLMRKTTYKSTINYIYLPFGFWGEDSAGTSGLKVRYGLNFKAMLFDDSSGGFDWDFLLGGKVYAGIAYSFGGVMDIFAQAYYSYNIPVKSTHTYGIEAGFKF